MKISNTKLTRALKVYGGFAGDRTVGAIIAKIPAELAAQLTGAQIGAVMNIINNNYHAGRSSLHGIDICDDAVWMPAKIAGKNAGDENTDDQTGKLIPYDVLRALQKDSATRMWTMPPTHD